MENTSNKFKKKNRNSGFCTHLYTRHHDSILTKKQVRRSTPSPNEHNENELKFFFNNPTTIKETI
jgi:predicted HNH restriction endonuclease